jgi:hypothetical protein
MTNFIELKETAESISSVCSAKKWGQALCTYIPEVKSNISLFKIDEKF